MREYNYRLSFVPTDRNVSAEECMPIYYYPTKLDAFAAAARDAMANATDNTPESRAYLFAAASCLKQAARYDTADTMSRWVSVDVGGLEARTIGSYYVLPVTIGDMVDCTTCGDFRGTVTSMGASGDVIACCEDCASEDNTTCRTCDGTAQWNNRDTCPACDGSGVAATN